MVRCVLPLGVAAILGASSVLAQTPPSCSLTQKCPKESPCCSQYGQCGVGAYCLGGCDPRMSFGLDSCVPAPVCQDRKMPMTDLDRVVDISEYLGDASKADWVAQGEPLMFNGNVLLTMPAKSAGTVLASTVYMWYGTVTAKLKTGRGAGVVTAFILLSDVKDEIDYEFVGTELDIAQTNYYFQGIPDYTHSGNTSTTDTFENFHEYKIEWTPDVINWYIDGKLGRTQKKSDTWNATANQWNYPQTPSRVQLSIWPGGASTNAEGTITWAGGPIDWNSQDIQNYGYDFATFGEVDIECWNATSGPGSHAHKSYYFNNINALNNSVVDSDKDTILGSFLNTGTNMGSPSNSTKSGSSSSASATAATIPGGGGSNFGGNNNGDNTGSTTGSGTAAAPSCSATGFQQSCGTSGDTGSKNAAPRAGGSRDTLLGTSAVAAVVALAGLMWL